MKFSETQAKTSRKELSRNDIRDTLTGGMPASSFELIFNYVKGVSDAEIAHDIKHILRVKRLALQIAAKEKFKKMHLVAAAALMHDIGLKSAPKRSLHGEVGAGMAEEFLGKNKLFSDVEIFEICNAIRYHCTKEGEDTLLCIVRDADILDLLGAHGLLRCLMYRWNWPDYPADNIKGSTWGVSNDYFDQFFASGRSVGEFVVDQLNFQISCVDNLKTRTGKILAKPGVAMMKKFLQTLEKEAGGAVR